MCGGNRPALYDAYHGIFNLTRFEEPCSGTVHIVGPVCESGDVLGSDREFPSSAPGDVVLVCNGGAYGRVMSSSYNLRAPAKEITIDTDTDSWSA